MQRNALRGNKTPARREGIDSLEILERADVAAHDVAQLHLSEFHAEERALFQEADR